MGENSKIEWTTHTFNPWRGCTKVAAGCAHCYADKQAKRNPSTLGIWGNDGTRVLASDAMWREPIKWNKAAACDCHARQDLGERHLQSCPQSNRPRVFCASMADVFEDWKGEIRNHAGRVLHRCSAGHILPLDSVRVNGIECDAGCTLLAHPLTMDDARSDLFKLIDDTPNLDWLLLTKRPQNIRRFAYDAWTEKVSGHISQNEGDGRRWKPRKNVWLGTSIATQEDADRNIPELLKCRDLSPVLFLSCEPLLGPVELMYPPSLFPNGPQMCCNGRDCGCQGMPIDPWPWFYPKDNRIDWVIAGGESGPHARPMHPAWARSLRDQCKLAGVPFHFKQWGEWVENGANIPVVENSRWGAVSPAGEWIEYEGGTVVRPANKDACMVRVGKRLAGRLLDGREWSEFPRVGANA